MSLKRRLERLEAEHGCPPGPVESWTDEDLERVSRVFQVLDPEGYAATTARHKAMSNEELIALLGMSDEERTVALHGQPLEERGKP